MSIYENDSLNNQSDYLKKTSGNNQDQNKVVFEGGTYSDKPTTVADVEKMMIWNMVIMVLQR